MKILRAAALILFLLVSACESQSPAQIIMIDGDDVQTIVASERVPLLILTQAGLTIGPNDRVLVNGILWPLDQPVPRTDSVVIQIRRAVTLTLLTPQGQQTIESAALTVGQALSEAGVQLYASDFLDPPANTFITTPLTINYVPSREITIIVNGQVVPIRASTQTVGEALAEAGIPLIGLDYSLPSENEALPENGEIRVVRVSESVALAMNPIPFTSEFVESPEVELGAQEIVQPGVNGLAISRIRIRYEDGKEVSRVTEGESVVRPPQTRIVRTGTKVVLHTTTVDGVTFQYWRAIEMYATSYSPCRSGVPDRCFSGTASGLPLKKGIVAVQKDWYYALQGVEVFVPGYGRAVIADLGGGFPDGRAWIDLGYSDSDWQNWSGWVTVYFLAPAPAEIPYMLQ
jgi:uncharacterized protein YabE (DUF348 family)